MFVITGLPGWLRFVFVERGMLLYKSGNFDYALDTAASMADSESDLDTDGLDIALDTLCNRYCSDESSLKSKEYCSEFCELVEEYTGQWQVPLPQLKVLRTALCSFTNATAAFPDDCQHIHYVLSSLALSFFELMLFFSKEEFVEDPLKDILDSFQECHSQLLRHRNIYLQHVKQIIKAGGPWENAVLQGILKEADLAPKEVEDYLSSELPILLELRVRYLQACERIPEAMALAKSCLENHEAGKHLYFHQAYLTCLYKASLHENLHKEMAEIDGHDAVEIICNTESVEKDELLLSLCKTFLTQQLHNGDMYYIWDLVFIWSRLYLRAHPSRQGFLAECLELASSATNVRAIFPFIKLVTTELGGEGVQVCVELCARALQLCDMQADSITRSLVCKTIAFLLPHDLEICRACALLVFCQERSLEAYRTVCLLYMHPDQEPHPHNSPVRTSVRFHILQMLKDRLCFDPEFWNLLTLRTHCLELISDNVMKAAVLNEMKEEEEKEHSEELLNNCVNDLFTQDLSSCQGTEAAFVNQDLSEVKAKRTWKDRVLRTQQYAHLTYHCNFCHKDYKGLNVMRHALSHLKSRKLKCILCGKHFKQLPCAKKHILDHIDEMCKHKPPEKETCTEDTPTTNGIVDNVENQNPVQNENQTSEETSEQKPGGRTKGSSLSREDRIIKNLRTLIKKSSVLHKKCKNPNVNIFQQVDFKNEQVVMKDDLVILKDLSVMEEEGEGEDKEKATEENGYGVDITYHLCPSESCDRVFLKVNTTLTRHAIKCHINEDKVLEKTFAWAKHKCTLCLRQIPFLQHYKDHMKLHNAPLRYFCYHLECNQRFLTHQELKDHVNSHQPFRPQCPFTDCEKLFSNLQGLYDHEWRHYIPVPQREELELGPNRQKTQNAEAPWKQRVKVEELWLQNKKGHRESPTPDHTEASKPGDLREISKTEEQTCKVNDPNSGQDLSKSDNHSEKTLNYKPTDDGKTTINGYEDVTQNLKSEGLISTSHTGAAAAAPTPASKKSRKRRPESDPLNVRDHEDLSSLGEGVQQPLGEPHITEHKSFKPEEVSFSTFVKAPFSRPPPSTYLDESLLSMRKRRSTDEAKDQPEGDVTPEQKIRHRCDKCLSSFGSLEELQKHQALNTCSALFGFDSDDESKCA
uniref:C2H2-type domain-containing protein n=1 Tax=Monopterus albus TaxID=43700 RepID=A0A3Q3Q6A7_MONAL